MCTEARAKRTSKCASTSGSRSVPFAVSASQESTLKSSLLSGFHEPSVFLRRRSRILGPRSVFADRTWYLPRQYVGNK